MNFHQQTAGVVLRVAFWPHVPDRQIASTRIRCHQVVDGLKALGVDAGLFEAKQPAPRVLVLAKRYDESTLKQALDLRARHGTRLVLDLCDNHLDTVEETEKLRRRRLSLEIALRTVDKVVVPTRALADRLSMHMPDLSIKLHVIGDSIDMVAVSGSGARVPMVDRLCDAGRWLRDRLHPVPPGRRLIWFGNHGSAGAEGGMQDIDLIAPILAQHHRRERLRLTVVSNNRDKFNRLAKGWHFDAHYVPWSLDALQRLASAHDISVIPARLNPFTECKSPNRVVTSFMMGWAVASSPLPSYVDMFGDHLVMDWDGGLQSLMDRPSLRGRQIDEADVIIKNTSDIRVVAGEWLTLLKNIEA